MFSGEVDVTVTPPGDLDVRGAYFEVEACTTVQAGQPVEGTYAAGMTSSGG